MPIVTNACFWTRATRYTQTLGYTPKAIIFEEGAPVDRISLLVECVDVLLPSFRKHISYEVVHIREFMIVDNYDIMRAFRSFYYMFFRGNMEIGTKNGSKFIKHLKRDLLARIRDRYYFV